jgi:hypothetical protein
MIDLSSMSSESKNDPKHGGAWSTPSGDVSL